MNSEHDKYLELGIEQVQALADISRSDCCHSNETRAPNCKLA